VELLPQRLLGPGLNEQSMRHPRATQPLLQLRCGGVRWGMDVDAAVSCVGCCDITQLSDHTTSTSGAGSGGWPG
jgi:hypothetical protein